MIFTSTGTTRLNFRNDFLKRPKTKTVPVTVHSFFESLISFTAPRRVCPVPTKIFTGFGKVMISFFLNSKDSRYSSTSTAKPLTRKSLNVRKSTVPLCSRASISAESSSVTPVKETSTSSGSLTLTYASALSFATLLEDLEFYRFDF